MPDAEGKSGLRGSAAQHPRDSGELGSVASKLSYTDTTHDGSLVGKA